MGVWGRGDEILRWEEGGEKEKVEERKSAAKGNELQELFVLSFGVVFFFFTFSLLTTCQTPRPSCLSSVFPLLPAPRGTDNSAPLPTRLSIIIIITARVALFTGTHEC